MSKSGASVSELMSRIGSGLGAGVDVAGRRLYLVGEVDEKMAYRFTYGLNVLDSVEGTIYVTLNSVGGCVDHGFAIYDSMRCAKNPIVVEVVGMAASIAAVILQGGDYRRATAESRVMVHQASASGRDGSYSANELQDQGRDLARTNDRMYAVLASRTKLSLAEIVEACHKDSFFYAKDALKAGFLDEIAEPTKVVTVRTESKTSKKAAGVPKKRGTKK